MTFYVLYKRLSDGLVVLESKHGRQMFSAVTLRKDATCAACGRHLRKKARAFSPITNEDNRWHRICIACVSGA